MANQEETGAEAADSKVPNSGKAQSGARDAGITAVVVVMVLLIRIMAVSGWNWDTAAELADAFNFSDAVPILFGTLFELPVLTSLAAAIILPLACYRLYLVHKWKLHESEVPDWVTVVILVVMLFVLYNTYGMWWPFALSLTWGLAISIFVFKVHKGEILELLDSLSDRTGTLLLIAVLALSVLVQTPWNPREEITLTDGSVIVGHVIETTPGFVKVLNSDKEVRIILTGDVASREGVAIPAGSKNPTKGPAENLEQSR